MTGFWNNEREVKLDKLWRAGVSTQLIADSLGTTKNAVIGKAHRLSLPRRTRDDPLRQPYWVPNALRLRDAGLSTWDISKRTNRPQSTIRYWLQRAPQRQAA